MGKCSQAKRKMRCYTVARIVANSVGFKLFVLRMDPVGTGSFLSKRPWGEGEKRVMLVLHGPSGKQHGKGGGEFIEK